VRATEAGLCPYLIQSFARGKRPQMMVSDLSALSVVANSNTSNRCPGSLMLEKRATKQQQG